MVSKEMIFFNNRCKDLNKIYNFFALKVPEKFTKDNFYDETSSESFIKFMSKIGFSSEKIKYINDKNPAIIYKYNNGQRLGFTSFDSNMQELNDNHRSYNNVIDKLLYFITDIYDSNYGTT